MAFSLKDISVTKPKIPIIVLYGPPGIGKTSFASQAPEPIFVRCEDGAGSLALNSFPKIRSFSEVMSAFELLYTEEHDYKTVVVDTTSALEPLIWKHTADMHGKSSIEDFGYGKGYVEATDQWLKFLQAVEALRDDKGIMPILLAHSDVVHMDPPDNEPYDRYQIKLHKRAFQLLYERADVIGFANAKPYIKKTKEGQKESKQAVDLEGRMLHLVEKPAYVAKNRYNMPESIAFPKDTSWNEFARVLKECAPELSL